MNELPALDEHEAARVLGLKVATLRAWRLKKKGPRFLRMGRAVRYRPADLADYIAARTVETRMELCLGLMFDDPEVQH
jgi:predicted DNA-binding transcriptional regulator AlpA